ncbi:hypothetical protein CH380_16510 [Leptospira adleri]|uniref:Uncharacterized protein n=1 Tax=Leptospira adleri TaxID=2023186 RepID=A0A2M9YKG3_9LEPT|nr:hypothetical protein CH380_16510 [Leptospira adleri]PJZ62905.1 hypothetical protein CH376_05290 [Leptospira adleri]
MKIVFSEILWPWKTRISKPRTRQSFLSSIVFYKNRLCFQKITIFFFLFCGNIQYTLNSLFISFI